MESTVPIMAIAEVALVRCTQVVPSGSQHLRLLADTNLSSNEHSHPPKVT